MRGLTNNIKLQIEVAARLLSEGGIVVIPTETVYGMAANSYSDGGSENRNILDTDLPDIKFKVTHLVAQKNGIPSNSMIERVFHMLKSEYKRVVNAQDKGHLIKVVNEVLQAYMDRPHSAHGVYIPREVLMKTSGWFDKKGRPVLQR